MISTRSALLERKTLSAILSDPRRAQVVIRLRDTGLSEEDIALALNCSQRIVVRYISAEIGWVRRVAADSSLKSNQQPGPRPIPRSASVLLRYRPPQTERGSAGERERLALKLAHEIRSWLGSIELSDAQRLQVLQHAGLLLDTSPWSAGGEHASLPFDVNRIVSELLSIWQPKTHSGRDGDFESLLGRWLSSWIRFWIARPIIWNRALDLEFAHFGAQDQAA